MIAFMITNTLGTKSSVTVGGFMFEPGISFGRGTSIKPKTWKRSFKRWWIAGSRTWPAFPAGETSARMRTDVERMRSDRSSGNPG